jgi:5-deoxy-D-glucuronate isomerase
VEPGSGADIRFPASNILSETFSLEPSASDGFCFQTLPTTDPTLVLTFDAEIYINTIVLLPAGLTYPVQDFSSEQYEVSVYVENEADGM